MILEAARVLVKAVRELVESIKVPEKSGFEAKECLKMP
jgi:hypothetical protein